MSKKKANIKGKAPPPKKSGKEQAKKNRTNDMTFIQHANELRYRIFISVILIVVIFTIYTVYSNQILHILTLPIKHLGYDVHYLKVQEALMATLKAAFFAAVITSSPVWVWIIAGFFIPAFTRKGRLILISVITGGLFLLIAGFVFSYMVLIPVSLNFLLSFSKSELKSIISIEFYLDYFLMLFFSTGVGFQLPLVMLFLAKLNIIRYQVLAKGRRYAVIIILIIAAALTPPDVISQVTLAVPLYLLYEIGLFITWLFAGRENY